MKKHSSPLPELDATFIAEVDEDLRKEQMARFWKRFAAPLSVAGVLVLSCTIGYVWWSGHQLQKNMQASSTLATILGQYNIDPAQQNKADIATKLKEAATSLPEAQAMLAHLYATGIDPTNAADLEKAAKNSTLPALYKDLAHLISLQTRLDKDDPNALKKELAPLAAEGSPWRYSAREMQALLDVRLKNFAGAKATLLALKADPVTSTAMRSRVDALLASLPSE